MSTTEPYFSESDISSLREQMKEQDFKASGEDYEDFMTGLVWEDMSNMLQERIDGLLERLEGMGNSAQEDIIIKARIHELRQLLKYPEHVIELHSVIKEEPDESDRLVA